VVSEETIFKNTCSLRQMDRRRQTSDGKSSADPLDSYRIVKF